MNFSIRDRFSLDISRARLAYCGNLFNIENRLNCVKYFVRLFTLIHRQEDLQTE